MKKKACFIVTLITISLGITSCSSSKSMLKEMLVNTTDLYYVTNTPEYMGEVKDDVYLNFIDYSNMDYYTSIKKKGYTLVPLLLYNFTFEKFEARLGERSLTMNYREFLTDALLTECNLSSCFNLIDNSDSIAANTAYILDIKITKNITKGKMTICNHAIFTGFIDMLLNSEGGEGIFGPFIVVNKNKTHPALTELSIKATLHKERKVLIEKEYTIKRSLQFTRQGSADSYMLNSICLNNMSESLSQATKDLVEEMSRELHLLMLSF